MRIYRQIVFGLALCVAICGDSWGQAQQQPSPQAEQSQQSQSNPATSQRGTELAPFIIKVLPAEETKADTAEDVDETDNEGRLVIATWVLVGVGFLQLIALGLQAFFVARTVTHMRISERAHVSGGANHVLRRDNGVDVLVGVVVTINNYGKTPANIGTVAVTICEEGELKMFPGWKIKTWPGHEFSAGWKGYVFGQVPDQKTDVVFPFQAGKVIAGRIWYRDIFQKQRSVGFLLKTDDLSAIGRRQFWEEREEKDPNE